MLKKVIYRDNVSLYDKKDIFILEYYILEIVQER